MSGGCGGGAAIELRDRPHFGCRATRGEGLEPYRQPILASQVIRDVGEPVAVVFAENCRIAEDAAELVTMDVAALPPRLDAEASDVEPTVLRKEYGALDRAFKSADALVSLELAVGRHSGVPLECRGALARVNPESGILDVHGPTKRPHVNRTTTA